MSERFSDMTKIPEQPAMRLLAAKATKLETKTDLPANASVEAVLKVLNEKEAWPDILKLMAVALPEREAVWWGCVAGRDLMEGDEVSPCLGAAQAWVFEPNDENRAKIQGLLETNADDPAALVAQAALYAPGTLGVGDLADLPAPAAGLPTLVLGMNMTAVGEADEPMEHLQWVIDRAVDIARGGNGNIEQITPAPEPVPVSMEED